MWGGELFVPKIPSYRILDVAKAIAPECKIDIIGVRPGEKIHEEMITETDSLNTIEFKDYFVILPAILSELWEVEDFRKNSNGSEGKFCEFGFKYNSGTNTEWLSVEEIKDLINKNTDFDV